MGIPLYGGCRDSGPMKQANSSASFHAANPVRISEEWCVHSFHVILFFTGFGCGLWQAVIDFRCWSALASNGMMRKRKRWREMHLQFPIKRPLCFSLSHVPSINPHPQVWIGVWPAYWCHGFVCFIWMSRMTFWPSACIVFFVFFSHFFHSPASSHCAGRGMRKSRTN